MAVGNVTRFNGQVLRAMALLYENHPLRYRLGLEDLVPASEFKNATSDDGEFAAGTLKWLNDNGYVSGEFLPAVGELDDVQLTAYAWRILQSTEPNSSIQPLGEAVRQAANSDERDLDVVADLLVRRLTGG